MDFHHQTDRELLASVAGITRRAGFARSQARADLLDQARQAAHDEVHRRGLSFGLSDLAHAASVDGPLWGGDWS